MEQMMELSDIIAEIKCLKEKLNEIYDENKQINSEMLEVSKQLDRKIYWYLKTDNKREFLSLNKNN